eukprot:snap_masked-scaffold_70-processed-gene-0.13-mRNA-1 protein AED:1.00 eAED:1.00 QI:0/0/0/0/1/1/2/0/64
MTFRRTEGRVRSNRKLVNEIQFSEVARINKFGDKTRLTWIGLFSVAKVLGSNVYLLNDVFEVQK